MSATLLDGSAVAKTMRAELRDTITVLTERLRRAPALAVVQVAGDAASDRYVRSIRKLCEDTGVTYVGRSLPAEALQAEAEAAVEALSADAAVDGILLQLPLPAHLAAAPIIGRISPQKDVDGVTPQSAGLLTLGLPGLRPNTPAGGMELLHRYAIPIAGKHAVVVGRSTIVGRPMALMLLHEHATVTIAHSRTPDLAATVRSADIVVAAVGKARLITANMVRPGATVIDFGVNVLDDGGVAGDVDAGVAEVAGAITPVPGGTGPMTNMMLLRNLVQASEAELRNR
jgi:methylenetetrahydrofolate dehydrogenase (NADP+)/methenyltetrahydrofolate cyclohydrolase